MSYDFIVHKNGAMEYPSNMEGRALLAPTFLVGVTSVLERSRRSVPLQVLMTSSGLPPRPNDCVVQSGGRSGCLVISYLQRSKEKAP
jgi:hypothetical protein